MEVQILEFNYETTNVPEIEDQINQMFDHYDIQDVQFTQWGDQLLVFLVKE